MGLSVFSITNFNKIGSKSSMDLTETGKSSELGTPRVVNKLN